MFHAPGAESGESARRAHSAEPPPVDGQSRIVFDGRRVFAPLPETPLRMTLGPVRRAPLQPPEAMGSSTMVEASLQQAEVMMRQAAMQHRRR